MYSGFITSKRTLAAVGVHQRFDSVAHRLIAPYCASGTFPSAEEIMHFEGVNGPDGLKVKSPGQNEPSHLYDPLNDKGPIPRLIKHHYDGLVAALKQQDMVRSSFEAAWLAHYVCDGLTPAHHFPLDEHIAQHGATKNAKGRYTVRKPGDTRLESLRKGWAILGGKGLLTTHFNFEMGAATAIIGQRIKIQLDPAKLAEARKIGVIKFFKDQAQMIAKLEMYEKFCEQGWTPEIARLIKTRLTPETIQTIAIIWLLAYLEAGMDLAQDASKSKAIISAGDKVKS
jgi:hypothetical protein